VTVVMIFIIATTVDFFSQKLKSTVLILILVNVFIWRKASKESFIHREIGRVGGCETH